MLARHFPSLARIRDRWSRAAIIMYHRVIETDSDPWGLAVAPDRFADQLAQFRRKRTVLSMNDFVARMRGDTLPRDAVAITFDDGYHDNLTNAAPALEAAGVPATLFLTTTPTRRAQPYWSDELAAMILDAVDPVDFVADLADGPIAVRFGPREPADDDRHGWRAWHPPRSARETAHYAIWDRIRALRPADADAAMALLRAALPTEPVPADRAMTPDKIRRLVASGMIALGGHTADHPDLPTLDASEALGQIVQGKAEAEAIIGAPISGFAYPYGRLNRAVRNLVVEAGFDWACTTEPGFVGASRTDPFVIPRLAAPDTSAIGFIDRIGE